MKRNAPILGLVIGLILPALGVLLMSFIWGHNDVADFLRRLMFNHDLAGKVLSLSLLLNIIPFIYFTSKRRDLYARGILIATVIYALVIILVKYVW